MKLEGYLGGTRTSLPWILLPRTDESVFVQTRMSSETSDMLWASFLEWNYYQFLIIFLFHLITFGIQCFILILHDNSVKFIIIIHLQTANNNQYVFMNLLFWLFFLSMFFPFRNSWLLLIMFYLMILIIVCRWMIMMNMTLLSCKMRIKQWIPIVIRWKRKMIRNW